jgi:hypothetical protein
MWNFHALGENLMIYVGNFQNVTRCLALGLKEFVAKK